MCHEIKDESEFYHTKVKKKGEYVPYIMPYCKVCNKKKNYTWKNNNREKWLQIQINANNTILGRKEEITERKRIYRKEGKQLNWQQNNSDKCKEYAHKYHSNKKHKITNFEWEACKKYFIHRCAYCGLVIEEHWIVFRGNLQLGDFHKEHLDDNGSNDLSNCVPSCKTCNSEKHEKIFEEWYNKDNPKFSQERLDKINKWRYEDHKSFMK